MRLRRVRRPQLSRALGAVLIGDRGGDGLAARHPLSDAIADHLPAALVNPTRSLETSGAVELAADRAAPGLAVRDHRGRSGLDDYGAAPEFTGNDRWFNSKPLTIEGLRGRVVLVDFWTYTCINCIRTLPHLVAWDKAYRDEGLTIVGVHSPEFSVREEGGQRDARACSRTASGIPSHRTTRWRRGTRGATGTGPRST